MIYDDYENMDDLTGKNKKSSKHKSLIDQLKDIENIDYDMMSPSPSQTETSSTFLASSMLKEQPKKKKKNEEENEDYDADSWFGELMSHQGDMDKVRKKIRNDLFDENGNITRKKKKKHKKGSNGELMDYKQEFEPEMALYKNLLVAQNRFTDSLQKEYDSIKSYKSSSRGVTKQMSDLIENITSARALAMQLVDKHVNVKKQIADLTLKQKKEFGKLDGEGDNMADFASNYLKQMLTDRQSLIDPTGEALVSDYSDNEMLEEINLEFTDLDESTVIGNKYLEYENRNVTIYIEITDNDFENYTFIAKAEDGEVLNDYPLPNHTKISVNRSTNVATDYFGQKFPIIWR